MSSACQRKSGAIAGVDPVCAAASCSQAWELSSPAFEHAVVRLGGNRKLTIDASGASRLRKYIQSAQFDGKPFDHTWLPSQKLHSGGRLSFVMGAQPAPVVGRCAGCSAARPLTGG